MLPMVTVEAIRKLARSLPRTEEAIVRDRLKYRVRGLVYVALSQDETDMGVAYPKHERDALIATDPAKFPSPRSIGRARQLGAGLAGPDRRGRDARTRRGCLAHG